MTAEELGVAKVDVCDENNAITKTFLFFANNDGVVHGCVGIVDCSRHTLDVEVVKCRKLVGNIVALVLSSSEFNTLCWWMIDCRTSCLLSSFVNM